MRISGKESMLIQSQALRASQLPLHKRQPFIPMNLDVTVSKNSSEFVENLSFKFVFLIFLDQKEIAKMAMIAKAFNKAVDSNKYNEGF